MPVNFGDILPERSKSSAFWDVGGKSSDSLYMPYCIELELEAICSQVHYADAGSQFGLDSATACHHGDWLLMVPYSQSP